MLLQLSLCVLTVIHLTSSQSTYDVIQQENDVSSCGRTEHVLSQLMTVVSQLQRDVAELKERKQVKGKPLLIRILYDQRIESRQERRRLSRSPIVMSALVCRSTQPSTLRGTVQ